MHSFFFGLQIGAKARRRTLNAGLQMANFIRLPGARSSLQLRIWITTKAMPTRIGAERYASAVTTCGMRHIAETTRRSRVAKSRLKWILRTGLLKPKHKGPLLRRLKDRKIKPWRDCGRCPSRGVGIGHNDPETRAPRCNTLIDEKPIREVVKPGLNRHPGNR